MKKIDVSIIVISYNHEKYIKEAIDSILKQKGTFTYEVIFADDHSSDNTVKLIKKYSKDIKNKKFIFNDINLGNTKNTLNAINNCEGKYITFLESDDFWYSENKIQNLYKFLEDNNDYIAASNKRCEMDKERNLIFPYPKWVKEDCDINLEDFLNLKFYSHIETMYRNIYPKDKKFNDIFTTDTMICDLFQCIYFLNKGKIRILNQNAGVYRTSSSGNTTNYNSTKKLSEISQDHIKILNKINIFYNKKLDLRYLYGYFLFPIFANTILKFDFKGYKKVKEITDKKYRHFFYLHIFKFFKIYFIVLMDKLKKNKSK